MTGIRNSSADSDGASLVLVPPFAPQPFAGAVQGVDPVALLLADKRSPQTKRAYAADLRDFFGEDATPDAVTGFCALPPPQVAYRLATYKADLLTRGLAEATINRRLAAVRSLLKMAQRLGYAQTDGRGLVDGEKVTAYRDTRGVDADTLRRLVRLPSERHGAGSVAALRDTALLRPLCENALRRAEVCALNVGDFDAPGLRLYVTGKGKGSQRAPVTLSAPMVAALTAYLEVGGHAEDSGGPLFRSLHRDPQHGGERLTANGLHWRVQDYGKALGIDLAPHKLRHSAITAALDATGGDVRAVQKLSRHAKLDTLMVYDDSRRDRQGEVTNLLAGLIG
jgi:integrase/recombinase XerC